MGQALNLIGQKFGKLVVVSRDASTTGRARWHCICDCGNTKSVLGNNLKNGHSTSCGCFRKAAASARPKTHGMTKTREFATWTGMLQRCTNQNKDNYENYGGRGITVCERWQLFENFFADMGVRPEGMTLDRLDVNQGYSKENCRWATINEQSRNRRNNITVEYQGQSMVLKDVATAAGISSGMASLRNKLGIPLDKPKNREFRHFSDGDKAEVRNLLTDGVPQSEIIRRCRVSVATLSRIRREMKAI